MPNRILKESICTSDTIDQLGDATEVFFYRLLVQCDDHGRMDARAAVLRARLYPLRLETVTDDIVVQRLRECAAVGLLTIYESGGRPYLIINNWKRHQQVRAAKSKYPEPPPGGGIQPAMPGLGQLISDDINGNQSQSDAPVFENRESRIESRESDSESGADAPNPELKEIPEDGVDDSKPLTVGQKFFLQAFGARRFRTPEQRSAVLKLETKYGTDRLKECTSWAAKKGMTLGDAIVNIESAIPTWGNKSKNGVSHDNTQKRSSQSNNGTQAAPAGSPLARKLAGRTDGPTKPV